MKFLLEKNYLTLDQEAKYNRLNPSQQIDFIKDWLEQKGHKKLITRLGSNLAAIIKEYGGFDSDENKFLNYLLEIDPNFNLTLKTVYLLANLINNDKLDWEEEWLYDPSLYEGSEDDLLYKIKALAYASNKYLQKDSSREVEIQDFLDEDGKILPAKDIKNILTNITVNKDKKSNKEKLTNLEIINIYLENKGVKKLEYGDELIDFILSDVVNKEQAKHIKASIIRSKDYKIALRREVSKILNKSEFNINIKDERALKEATEDIIFSLKEQIINFINKYSIEDDPKQNDIVQALLALGANKKNANIIAETILNDPKNKNLSIDELINKAIREYK